MSIFRSPRFGTSRRGFTLLEVLIAASIFSIVGMLATSIFVNLSQNKQKITSGNIIYDDAQFTLDQLTRQIASNTIDYEEYYNQLVLGGKPGMNFGNYASQFYYNLKGNGSICMDLKEPGKDNQKSCVNTGKNPRSGNFPDSSNAFYTSGVEPGADAKKIYCDGFPPYFTSTKYHACVTRLFLINGAANHKTLIASEKIDWGNNKLSHVLAQTFMKSFELPNNNGTTTTIPHIFTCELGSLCTDSENLNLKGKTMNLPNSVDINADIIVKRPNNSDLEDLTAEPIQGTVSKDQLPIAHAYVNNFIPFTPSRVNIKDIKFYISPVEDPHKAFAEANENNGTLTNIHQPTVTIVLTVEPISNARFGTKYPSLTVQTTVTPGLFSEVESYPPQMQKTTL